MQEDSLVSEQLPQIVFDEGDVDRQLAWHQNRLQSNVQSHQRRACLELAKLHQSSIFNLSSIRLVGAKHTQSDFLASLFKPIFGDGKPRTFSEILKSSDQLYDRLAKLGIFSHLQISLDAKQGDPKHIEALIKVVERGRFFLKTSTDVGNGEGALTGLARARNIWGRAEVLEASVGLGSRTKASCQVKAEAPICSARARCELSGHACERDLSAFASCQEKVKGVLAKLKTETGYGFHELSYELATRSIGNLLPGASESIRATAAAGPTFKSAIAHSWTRDTRDHSAFPTQGSSLQLVQEYAGLGGDASYLKSIIESAIFRPVFGSQIIASLGFRAGLMHPLNGRPIVFNDKFQLGGPTNVRMFQQNSLGPKDGNDYLGGEMYWASGFSILSPIPGQSEWPLKLHAFINAGRLANEWDKLKSSKPSVGVGIGMVGKIQDIRVEANLGMPLCASEGDGTRKVNFRLKGQKFGYMRCGSWTIKRSYIN
ncbi:hypothetical protein O181_000091 [Austropuccinia psidii MF-1]|uniref:POTRA domain-containing protein n=1 Tax=Austropuccinia psidii MF-1 TaxID=1389203 RepID=A0A9Q3GBA0_9BASI|nr:hypothetical protein [Austropuccinia psidii MF-1]